MQITITPVRVNHDGNDVDPFDIEVECEHTILSVKEAISKKVSTEESRLDVHRVLLSRVEENLSADVFFDNEKSCSEEGLENGLVVHFYKWYHADSLPPSGIPENFSEEELIRHTTFGDAKKKNANDGQSALYDLSWRPLYDQMLENDESGEHMKNNAVQSDPTEIFLNNFQLPFASAWPGWEAEKLTSTKKFFEKLAALKINEFGEVFEQMRENLARNCTLKAGEVTRRGKKKILTLEKADRIAENQWTPEVTLSKLHEMTKTSGFKGFAKTREAGQEFIMDKAIFLLYLAYVKRTEDMMMSTGVASSHSFLDVVTGAQKVDEKQLSDLEQKTEFVDSGEKGAELTVAPAGKAFAAQVDLLLEMKSQPERFLGLIKGGLDIAPTKMIGTLCQHTAWSYRLDDVLNRLVSHFVQTYHTSKASCTEAWVQNTCSLLLWVGVLRGSLQDLVQLANILDDTKHSVDLTADLALFFNKSKYDLFSKEEKMVLQGERVIETLTEAGWYVKPGEGRMIDGFHGTEGDHHFWIYPAGEGLPNPPWDTYLTAAEFCGNAFYRDPHGRLKGYTCLGHGDEGGAETTEGYFPANIMYDAERFYTITDENIYVVNNRLDKVERKEKLEIEEFEVYKNKKEYHSESLSKHLLFVKVDKDGKPIESTLLDKQTLQKVEEKKMQDIVTSLKAGHNKLRSIVYDGASKTLYFFCVDKEKKTVKLFSYDADNNYTQNKNSPLRPNYEILVHEDTDKIGMMGVHSGIGFFFIADMITFISMESGELIDRAAAERGVNWFDKANPGSFLNYKKGVLTSSKPKTLPGFAQNFLPGMAHKMKRLVFAKKASSQIKSELLLGFVGLKQKTSSEKSKDSSDLTNREQSFILSQLLATINEDFESSRYRRLDQNPLGLVKKPLQTWQTAEFYKILNDRVGGVLKNYRNLSEPDQVHEVIQALNFAKLLFNNLKSLLQNKTKFATLMGSLENANDYFCKASANVLALQILVQQLGPAIPKYHAVRCSKVWEGFTNLMGAGKIVEVSSDSILNLLKPIQQRADADKLLSTAPVLNLLSSHIQHVTSNESLNNILKTSVQGILQSAAAASSIDYLVKVIEQASLTLLDTLDTANLTEKERGTEKLKQEKTLDFLRMCFRVCLEMILDSKEGCKEALKAQTIVLKMTTLVRSLNDATSLQHDFVEIIKLLDAPKLSNWITSFGDEILLRDCLQTMGLRIAELVNFDKKGEKEKKASMEGTPAHDQHKAADLIIQSNLFSSGFENRFLSQIYTDEKEMQAILELETTNDVTILPEQVKRLLKAKSAASSGQENDPETINTSEPDSPLQGSDNVKDQTLHAILNEGANPRLDELITALQTWLTKQKTAAARYARLGQALGMRLSRAAFAVMVKLSGKTRDLITMLDEFEFEMDELTMEKGTQRDLKIKQILDDMAGSKEILDHWQNASKMRPWFQSNKLIIAEDVTKAIKSEAQANSWDAEEQAKQFELAEEKKILESVKAVEAKAAFLVMLKTPKSFRTQEVNAEQLLVGVQKELTLMMKRGHSAKAGAFQGGQQTKEEWNEAFKSWKKDLSAEEQPQSEAQSRNELLQAGTGSVLSCLQSPVLRIEHIQTKLKGVYSRASRRLAGLNLLKLLCEKFIGFMTGPNDFTPETSQFVTNTMYDILGWFSSIQRPDEAGEDTLEQFNYLDDVVGCGVQLEDKLRDTFFKILELMTTLLSWASHQNLGNKDNYMLTRFVLSVFQWSFLARDYQSLQQRLGIFKFLNSGERVEDCGTVDLRDGQFINFWIDPRSQLSKDLLATFEDIFLSITRRIADADRKSDKAAKGGPMVMQRQQSKIDVSSTSIMFRNAFALIFRQMSNFTYVSQRLATDKTVCIDDKECDLYAADYLRSELEAKSADAEKRPATIRDSDWYGDQNEEDTEDYVFPTTDDVARIPYTELPTLKEIAWDSNGSIRLLQWTMSDDKVSEKAGGSGQIYSRERIAGNEVRQIKVYHQTGYDKIGRVHFFDAEGKQLMRIYSSEDCYEDGDDRVKVVDLGEDEKLVGLRVRHGKGDPVRGISFKIAKRAAVDASVMARIENVNALSAHSNHLMVHDAPPDDPKVLVDYRITEVYGFHEGHTKHTYPALAKIVGKPYKKMNKLQRCKYDRNGSLRCVKWWMEDGSESEKIGGYSEYYDRSFDGKRCAYISCQDRVGEPMIGKIEFFDDKDELIFELYGDSSHAEEKSRIDIAKDETLAGMDWYTCGEHIRGVAFIIIKEKTRKKVPPAVTGAFDIVTNMLREKYQAKAETWEFAEIKAPTVDPEEESGPPEPVSLIVQDYEDSTATDAWRPSQGKVTEAITGKVAGIACSVRWSDQGWGNQKGQVKVALERGGEAIAFENLFPARAPHEPTTQTRDLKDEDVVTKALPGDKLALYHIVGGGGGHSLTIAHWSVRVSFAEKEKVEEAKKEEEVEQPKQKLDESQLLMRQQLAKRCLMDIYRGEMEASQIDDALQMVLIFTSAAQNAQYPLEVLSHVANASNITTLLELLIDGSPMAKMTVLSILKNLIRIKVPDTVFAEGMKNLKNCSITIQPLVKFSNELVQMLYNFALQIRTRSWTSLYTEEAGGLFGVSVRLIQTASLVLKLQPSAEDDFSAGFLHLLNERSKEDPKKSVQIREELKILFEFVGAQLQTAVIGDLLVKTQTNDEESGLNQSETCRNDLKDNLEEVYGHEISLEGAEALKLHLSEEVCGKFLQVLSQEILVSNKDDLRLYEATNALQAQICKYFILHAGDLGSKMTDNQLRELAHGLYKHTVDDQLKGYLAPPEKLKYAPWVFEHAYARSTAMLVDKQRPGDRKGDGLVRLEEMKEKLQLKLMAKAFKAQGSEAGSKKSEKKGEAQLNILFRTRSSKGDSDDEEAQAPAVVDKKGLVEKVEAPKKQSGPAGESESHKSPEKMPGQFKVHELADLLETKNQKKIASRMGKIRRYIQQTGALVPEIILALLDSDKARDEFRAKLSEFAAVGKQSSLLDQERVKKYQSFILQHLVDGLLSADDESIVKLVQNECKFDETAQKVQSGFLIVELPKSDELNNIWNSIWDGTNKSYSDWSALGTTQADALKHKADKFTILEKDIVEQIINELKSFGVVHVLNSQLKRKLLNKMLYKFTEAVIKPGETEQEELINTGNSAPNDPSISLRLLWFTTQHLVSTENCRESSSGVECSWQDPDDRLTDQHWKLLLYRISNIPEFGPQVVNQLIFRTIGQITRELHIWMQVMSSKPLIEGREATLAERSDLTCAEESTSKLNISASLLAVFTWPSILKTLRLLEYFILMFAEKHDEEVWHRRKAEVLFTPVNGGPSVFTSMVQIYLNVAVNLGGIMEGSETSKNSSRPDKVDQHLYMRRGLFESVFRLMDIVGRADYSSQDILKYTLQPLFESDMLKRLATKVAEQIEGGELFNKGIFNYLCADFTCQAVTCYVIIARKIFADGTAFRVKVSSEYMHLAALVEKGKVLPEKKGLTDALAFLKEIVRQQLDENKKDEDPADAAELTTVDINCKVKRGKDGRLEGVDKQEILTPLVTFESQYALNIVDNDGKRVFTHLFAEIGDTEDKKDHQWLPSFAVKELGSNSDKYEPQVTLDSNFATVYLPSEYSRVLVHYQFNAQGELIWDKSQPCTVQNKGCFKTGGQIPHTAATEPWWNEKMDPERILAVTKDELFFCSPAYENQHGKHDSTLRALSLSGDRKGKVSSVKTPMNTHVHKAVLPIHASSRTEEEKEQIKNELTVKLVLAGQKSADKYGQVAKQIKELNKKWNEMTLETANHIKPDITTLEKDEFVSSLEGAHIVYLIFDLTDRKTLDSLMQTVGPWILEAKECKAQFVLLGTNMEERMRRLVRNEKDGLFTTSRAILLSKYNKHSQSVNQRDLLADFLEVELMREEQLVTFQQLIEPSLTHKFKNYVSATRLNGKETITAVSSDGKVQVLQSDVNRIVEFSATELKEEVERYDKDKESYGALKTWENIIPGGVADLAFSPDCRLFATSDGKLHHQGLKNLIGAHTLAERWEWAATDPAEPDAEIMSEVKGKVSRVWQYCNGETRVAFISVDDKLYSYGQCEHGMLAQGSGVTKSEKFAPCKYETKPKFADLFFVDNLVMAIDTEGEIWVIGGEDFLETVPNITDKAEAVEKSAFDEEKKSPDSEDQKPEPEKERTVQEKLAFIEVAGAGTPAANGIYSRCQEDRNGRAQFKCGDRKSIFWWDEGCGWELYHDGVGGSCTYWTSGATDNDNPVLSTFKVRGGADPAPTVTYFECETEFYTPKEEKVVSPQSADSINMVVKNAREFAVDFDWMDFDGKAVNYKTLQPGEVHEQQTYSGHIWRFRNSDTKAVLSFFNAPKKNDYRIVCEKDKKADKAKDGKEGDSASDPKYQKINIYEPLDTGLMKANNLRAVKIASFCQGPNFKAKIILTEDSQGQKSLYKSHGPQNASLTKLDIGEVFITDFITSCTTMASEDPADTVFNIYMVSDIAPVRTRLEAGELKAQLVSRAVPGKFTVAEKGKGPHADLMKEYEETFPRANFEQTLTRLLTVLNYQVDAMQEDYKGMELTMVKNMLEGAKGELEARLSGKEAKSNAHKKVRAEQKCGADEHPLFLWFEEFKFPGRDSHIPAEPTCYSCDRKITLSDGYWACEFPDVGRSDCCNRVYHKACKTIKETGDEQKVLLNKLISTFDGESRKTVLSIELAISVLRVNSLMGTQKDNCVRSDPWRYDKGKMRKGGLTCAGLSNLQSANGFMLNHILAERIQKINDSLPSDGSCPDLRVRRIFASKFQMSGEVDHNQTDSGQTMFTQSLKQFKASGYKHFLRKSMKERSDRPFRVYFKGEGSIDDGGPLRETFDFFCLELQAGSLPVLVPTENRRADVGEMRERFVLNPNCGRGEYAAQEMDMLYYFGILIGFAIRSTNPMPLNLHPIFWKFVVNPDWQVSESDLFYVDQYSWKMLNDMRKAAEFYTAEEFEAAMDQTFVFVTRNADGTDGEEIELCCGGKQRKLSRSNTEEFISLTVKVILTRAAPQMAKVREGIEYICGAELPYALSWRYAEERAVGKTDTDVEYLKRYTMYEDHFNRADSKCKKWFWEIMHEMTEEDRQLYLRFVNGQSKLPSDLNNLAYKHALRGKGGSGDASLPEAHTCYNQLDCPEYSSKEIMRMRITTAIRWCGEVDNDGSPEQY